MTLAALTDAAQAVAPPDALAYLKLALEVIALMVLVAAIITGPHPLRAIRRDG